MWHYASAGTSYGLCLCPSVGVCLNYYYTTYVQRPFFRTTQVSRYQKGKTNLDFTEARDSEWQWHKTNLYFTEPRDSEWQWHQLGHMQVCTSLQTDNHASTPPLSFLQAGCPSCRPTNSIKALKAAVLSRCYIKRDGQIDLVFLHGGFFQRVLHCVIRKFRYLQK